MPWRFENTQDTRLAQQSMATQNASTLKSITSSGYGQNSRVREGLQNRLLLSSTSERPEGDVDWTGITNLAEVVVDCTHRLQ